MTFTKLSKAITAEELLSTPLPPVKWIVPGLLPTGLALFAGPSKAGKSWLTLWLCLQVAQGKPVWGREIEPRTVLYSENDADDANDADIDITQLSGWDISKIVSQASLASSAKPWRGKYGA